MATILQKYPKSFQWRAFIRLVRFGNLIMIGFTQYLVKIFLIDPPGLTLWEHFEDIRFFWLSCSTVFIAAAGYIINDYYDIKIDLVNKPQRVIVGKKIRRRIALSANLSLNTAAVLIGLYLRLEIALIHISSIFLLWWYSNYLKRTPLWGNITIALLTAATVWVVGVFYNDHPPEIYIYASFAFFISLVREIIKDMEDVRGDAHFGCKTLPIIWGIAHTKTFTFALIFLFICNLAVGFFFLEKWMTVYLASVIFIPVAWLIIKLYKADRRRDFRYLSKWCKLIMFIGLGSIFFASLT